MYYTVYTGHHSNYTHVYTSAGVRVSLQPADLVPLHAVPRPGAHVRGSQLGHVSLIVAERGEWEGGREGEREERRKRGREGRRERGRERGRKGGREGGRKEGRKGSRKGGRVEERDGGREGGREGGRREGKTTDKTRCMAEEQGSEERVERGRMCILNEITGLRTM